MVIAVALYIRIHHTQKSINRHLSIHSTVQWIYQFTVTNFISLIYFRALSALNGCGPSIFFFLFFLLALPEKCKIDWFSFSSCVYKHQSLKLRVKISFCMIHDLISALSTVEKKNWWNVHQYLAISNTHVWNVTNDNHYSI